MLARIAEFDAVREEDVGGAVCVVSTAAAGRVDGGCDGSILVLGAIHLQ